MTVKMYDTVMNSKDITIAKIDGYSIKVTFRSGETSYIRMPERTGYEYKADYDERVNKQLKQALETIIEAMETDDRVYLRVGSR